MEPREPGGGHQESEGIDASYVFSLGNHLSRPPFLEEGHSPSSTTILEILDDPSLSSRHIIVRRG
jgi:hypothetical protein